MAYRKKTGRTLRSRRTRRTYRRRRGTVRKFRRVYRRKHNMSGNFYQMTRYVPYTAYSSTGTGANTSVGSLNGDIVVFSTGYALASTPADTDGYAYSSARFYFAATDIYNISEYMNLFEEYKICNIRFKIRYVGNGNNPNTLARGASGTSAQYLPTNPNCYLCYRKMHRDCAIPTASGTGWLNFRDSSGIREYRYPGRKEINLNIRPFTMQSQQTTAGSLSNEDNNITRRSPWLTTGNSTYTTATSVPHYGIDIMLRCENFITNDATNIEVIPHIFNITAYYSLKFRYRKAGATQL